MSEHESGPALVTGVTGQDGTYLARQLRAAGRGVVGTARPGTPSSVYLADVDVRPLEVSDTAAFVDLLEAVRPAEVFHLAAFSSVGASWGQAPHVGEVNGQAVLRMLEALLAFRARHGWAPRFLHASSAEVFGALDDRPRTESDAHHPRSPYAAAKSFAHHLVVAYREAHGLFAVNGILYNHESPLRGRGFVTRKITRAAAEIALGRTDRVRLGNLAVSRDWGHAADHVRGMVAMLAADEPHDLVLATGVPHSLRDLLETAFDAAGLGSPDPYLVSDPALFRPVDGACPLGDASSARTTLGWRPRHTFDDVVREMVAVDLRRVESGVEESPAYL